MNCHDSNRNPKTPIAAVPHVPFAEWDYILVSSSAGKDSQAMLDKVAEQARAEGVSDRVIVVHSDLGRVEWEGTEALAREQAAHYGFRFEVVRREQDLLDHVASRGMWPGKGPKERYCTSDHKTSQIAKLMTRIVAEKGPRPKHRPVRILDCQGIRGAESTKRGERQPLTWNKRASNTKREVYTYYPIFDWTVEQVWERIHASGVRYHYAYDLGMPRLSCVFCIFAPKEALIIAGTHNRALLDEYVRVEQAINHKFTAKLSLVQIQAAVAAGERVTAVGAWGEAA